MSWASRASTVGQHAIAAAAACASRVGTAHTSHTPWVSSRSGRAAAPRAIRARRAFAVDATAHFSRPGPRVADGVELLAGLLHPEAFPHISLAGRARPLEP